MGIGHFDPVHVKMADAHTIPQYNKKIKYRIGLCLFLVIFVLFIVGRLLNIFESHMNKPRKQVHDFDQKVGLLIIANFLCWGIFVLFGGVLRAIKASLTCFSQTITARTDSLTRPQSMGPPWDTSGINVAILSIEQHRSTMQDAFCLLRGDLKRLFIGRFFTGVKVDSVIAASACDAFGTMFVLYETF